MRIRLTIRHKGAKDWYEEYDPGSEDPQKFAADMINSFNASLRPGERPRTLVGWEDISAKKSKEPLRHRWVKLSLMTETGGYDKMKCEVCGITGKRHGINECVDRDSRFRAKRFADCDKAKAYLHPAAKEPHP